MNRGAFNGFEADSPGRFVSHLIPYTGTTLNVAVNHGLGATPAYTRWVYVCTLADNGYSAGDEIDTASGATGSAIYPTRWANAAQVGYVIGAEFVAFPHRTTQVDTALTVGKWSLKCYAWR